MIEYRRGDYYYQGLRLERIGSGRWKSVYSHDDLDIVFKIMYREDSHFLPNEIAALEGAASIFDVALPIDVFDSKPSLMGFTQKKLIQVSGPEDSFPLDSMVEWNKKYYPYWDKLICVADIKPENLGYDGEKLLVHDCLVYKEEVMKMPFWYCKPNAIKFCSMSKQFLLGFEDLKEYGYTRL